MRVLELVQDREGPLPVRRQRHGLAVSKAHGRGAVSPAHVGRVASAAARSAFIEENAASIPGQPDGPRPVEPAQVALLFLSRRQGRQPEPPLLVDHQNAAVFGNILKGQRAGHASDDALPARRRDGMEGPAGDACREPDLGGVREPGQALAASEGFRDRRLLSCEIHDRNRAAVVADDGMVQKGDPVALGRDARVSDPAVRLEENLADRVLQPGPPIHGTGDGELLPVGRPVRKLDAFEEMAGGASSRRAHARQCPDSHELAPTSLWRPAATSPAAETASRSAPGRPKDRDSGVPGELRKISIGLPSQAAL